MTGVLDVADGAAVQAWLSGFDAAPPVDLVVANAGISAGTRPNGDLEGIAAAISVVRTNLLGVVHTVEALLPGMLARDAGQVAVVASVAGIAACQTARPTAPARPGCGPMAGRCGRRWRRGESRSA